MPYASIPIFIMDYSGHVYRASDDDEDEDGEVMQRHGSLETWDQVRECQAYSCERERFGIRVGESEWAQARERERERKRESTDGRCSIH